MVESGRVTTSSSKVRPGLESKECYVMIGLGNLQLRDLGDESRRSSCQTSRRRITIVLL